VVARANGSTKPPAGDDLEFQEGDDLDTLEGFSDEGARHYVYRFLGPSSTSKRELAGRIDDAPRPDPHDVGTKFGGGLYVIISKQADGQAKTSKVFRVSDDYGRPAPRPPAAAAPAPVAAAAAPVAPAAVPVAAAPAALDLGDTANILRQLVDIVKDLKTENSAKDFTAKSIKELLDTQAVIMKAQRDMMWSQLPMQLIGAFTGQGKSPAGGGDGKLFGLDLEKLFAGLSQGQNKQGDQNAGG
jgi:hypothetical protein